MIVSSTDFKTNLGKYLILAQSEDIIVLKNGKEIGRFIGSNKERINNFLKMRGIISSPIDEQEILKERLLKLWEFFLTQTL